MPRLKHPEDGKVYACPDCDGASEVYRRKSDGGCRCHKCGSKFDDPIERDAKSKTPPTNEDADGLPASLGDDAKEIIRTIRGP